MQINNELVELYPSEPLDRQAAFIEQIAAYDPTNPNVLLGSSLAGLGGLHRHNAGELWSLFWQFSEYLNRVITNVGTLQEGYFMVPVPRNPTTRNIIELSPHAPTEPYETDYVSIGFVAMALYALKQEEIDNETNQIERGVSRMRINPALGYHVYDSNTGKITSKDDFNGLPEIVGACFGLRLIFDPETTPDLPILNRRIVNGVALPSYLFDGVVIVDSGDLITREQLAHREQRLALAKFLSRIKRADKAKPTQQKKESLVIRILNRIRGNKEDKRKEKRKK